MAAKTTKNEMIQSESYKPLSIARNELMQNLVKAINDSTLPAVIIEYVVRDFYEEVRMSAAKQYEQDKKQYEENLSNQQKD